LTVLPYGQKRPSCEEARLRRSKTDGLDKRKRRENGLQDNLIKQREKEKKDKSSSIGTIRGGNSQRFMPRRTIWPGLKMAEPKKLEEDQARRQKNRELKERKDLAGPRPSSYDDKTGNQGDPNHHFILRERSTAPGNVG